MSTSTTTRTTTTQDGPKTERVRGGYDKQKRAEARLGWLLAGPAFAVMILVTIYPILQAAWQSLYRSRLTAPDDQAFIGLQNYAVILGDPLFYQSLGVTLFITVVTVVVELVLGFALALVMHRAIRGTRGLVRTAILVPYGIITVVSAFAWYYAFASESGYVNNWLSIIPGFDPNLNWFAQTGTALSVIILSEVWKTTPFVSLLLLAGLSQVPDDLSEAAQVDGAGWWTRMFRITIPIMLPSIMVATIFRALDAFRIFDNVFIMTNGANGTNVLSLLAYNTSIGRLEIGLGSAVSVLLFLCVVIICFTAVKLFRVDLTGVKEES